MDTVWRDDSESFKGKLSQTGKISRGREGLFRVGRNNLNGSLIFFLSPLDLSQISILTVTYLASRVPTRFSLVLGRFQIVRSAVASVSPMQFLQFDSTLL